jgi:hypothetical protein
MKTMLVATCNKCRAWYNQDFEEGLDDEHFDPHTGEVCFNEYDWHIVEVPYREDWRNAY